MSKTAIIIGAGPAGLTAAYELITRTDIKPVVIEKSDYVGGLSRTINYKGNRMDIGGHRFFSKSDVIMKWWLNIFPLQGAPARDEILAYKTKVIKQMGMYFPGGPDPEKTDNVMLVRNRLSRIFYLRKFFDYPVTLSFTTLYNLGIVRTVRIIFSYLKIKILPVKKIENLEDFFISRFGKELYKTFFRDYTQKIWGVPSSSISAEWGTQRIKELSISKTIRYALKSLFLRETSIEQKDTETSLIRQFLYPKYGPGQLWEKVAALIEEKGGTIIKNTEVKQIIIENNRISKLVCFRISDNKEIIFNGDYFFSSMPVKDLIKAMGEKVPGEVKKIASGLQYRDFITVGLLLKKLKIKNKSKYRTANEMIPDNWIYIQERDVRIGRLQIFNNWSPYMVTDLQKPWIGLEYFCSEGDELWNMPDDEFIRFAIDELHKIGIIDRNDVLDATIERVPKTYPAYFGTFSKFGIIRDFTDSIENIFLIGRNGMHRYNNQDHSMLTAIRAVENIIYGIRSRDNIWNINIEERYHEEK